MSSKSANLHRARAVKNDEFYTRYEDVRKECDNYLSHFFNKTIYCNCDTADSAFVKYFTELKAAGQIRDVCFSGGLGGDDFRSAASVELLKRADVIVTNPPFSLFREFMGLLAAHDKHFLIIGNMNAVAYEQTFSLIRANKVRTGCTYPRAFIQPDGRLKKFGNICWFTNLTTNRKRDARAPHSQYYGHAAHYPKYDNADAINVNKIKEIPTDYTGIMGVPVTFLLDYDSDKFEVLGMDKDFTPTKTGVILNGRPLYRRIFIRNRYAVIANDDRFLKFAA